MMLEVKLEMEQEGKKSRKAYFQKYRRKNLKKIRARQREYQKQFREKNPEKVIAYNLAYWKRKAEEVFNDGNPEG